jgi:hypothetical protein
LISSWSWALGLGESANDRPFSASKRT